jgi:5-(carboxyamino)imidazole ribonucleotide mutase
MVSLSHRESKLNRHPGAPSLAPPLAPPIMPLLLRGQGMKPAVGIIMGSQSDWSTMQRAAETLAALAIPYETRIVSAHRTPTRLYRYARSAARRGLKVILAGAGGAAHLPGMTASMTNLPVFGVPIESRALKGLDSLLSIAQMPAGIPVGTLAIGEAGAVNAALLAASVLALSDRKIAAALAKWRKAKTDAVAKSPRPES